MAPTYKLTYFNGRGTGEPIRYLLKYGNIEFEDVRLTQEEWPKYKNSFPYGKLPVLEKDGVQIGESMAICRYLGNILNLAGKDAWENLQIDSVVDAFIEMRPKLYEIQETQDAVEKKAKMDKFINEFLPFYLSKFEAGTKKNKGYVALDRLTWADILFTSVLSDLEIHVGVQFLKDYPGFTAMIEKVTAIPQIKKWIETRPVTPF